MRTNSANTIWWVIVGIACLTICAILALEYQEEPKRDNGLITVDYESQKY